MINLSNIQIPNDVQLLLQLGHQFNLSITDKKTEKEKITIEVLKNMLKNLWKECF